MSDQDRKSFIRMRNQGYLPWEIEPQQEPQSAADEHPVFGRTEQVNHNDNGARVQPLPKDFMPEPRYIQWLEKHHGVPPKFTLAQLPEFKLYWLETGEARKAWQNKFKNHVIYQWKRQQSERQQRPHRSTIEELTDCSWADGVDFDDEL
ncbi:hypothetical protein H0A36_04735 [Endozoicomonas sp. SM1973]|uniref:DnaT DNA-binding domain-containing protein n=1 Tax=Spartinivicinus marinus TaxID=2994442 RepID=A0A853I7V6_9GAMM|nr:DnaT-like ssDNA-binding domain-containing protein [Spartinivicinus marinus]MCX4025466.1 DnaT-like ssDNA-binding domain-containing protein [Spartinivicinus marinus]NYZ65305.1 hypothetical protein [Spartinivicinus marinus]